MASEFCTLKVDEIIFDEKLYPRFDIDNDAVERYRLNLDSLPPITISKKLILIDGKHRLRAYQLSQKQEIPVEILDIEDETEILKEAIRRNAIHGKQLDMKEKKSLARKLFNKVETKELPLLLGVHLSNIYRWVEDLQEAIDEEKDMQIVSLFLKCWTQEKIAEVAEVSQQTVSNLIQKFRKCEKLVNKPKAVRESLDKHPDSLQRYDVWSFSVIDKTYGQDYPGRIPGQIIENVLWYWTKPLDIVCDPMCGGGTTIDVCKSLYRRYLGFDVNVVHDDAIKHDIKDGWPKIPETYEKANLIFLDPPYFKKKAKEYNLPEEYNTKAGFMEFAQSWVEFCRQGIAKNGVVALLISDFVDYDNPDESIFSFEYAQLFMDDFDLLYKISVPLSTQQYQAFHVSRAEEEKRLLIIGRELYIFRNGQ